jgi:SanA protein
MRKFVFGLIESVKAHPKITIALLLTTPIFVIAAINIWILKSANGRVFTDITALPENDVALVLGAGRTMYGGSINLHFKARTEAAAHLYHLGKVKHLLLSGDNHLQGYDEPSDMKEALLKLGVPESAMTLDYAGFRTLDSVVRAKEVFGLNKLTIVTDDFHIQRAIFLSEHYGLEAVAYCSAKIPLGLSANVRLREIGARVKAVMDVYLLNTRPKFLGEKVEIKI